MAGPERVVLCRCDSGEAIGFGQSLGVTMFQGRYVSEMLRVQSTPAGKILSLQR